MSHELGLEDTETDCCNCDHIKISYYNSSTDNIWAYT